MQLINWLSPDHSLTHSQRNASSHCYTIHRKCESVATAKYSKKIQGFQATKENYNYITASNSSHIYAYTSGYGILKS